MLKMWKSQLYFFALIVMWSGPMVLNWINSTPSTVNVSEVKDSVVGQLQSHLSQMEKRQEQHMEFFFRCYDKASSSV